jgi:DNA-binding transcriptional LysR family regulator
MVARSRSFESALAFVEAGLGVAIVPELAARHQDRPLFDLTLYALPIPRRRTFAVLPDHYLTLPALRVFLDALKDGAAAIAPLPVRDAPIFARTRLRLEAPESVQPLAVVARP